MREHVQDKGSYKSTEFKGFTRKNSQLWSRLAAVGQAPATKSCMAPLGDNAICVWSCTTRVKSFVSLLGAVSPALLLMSHFQNLTLCHTLDMQAKRAYKHTAKMDSAEMIEYISRKKPMKHLLTTQWKQRLQTTVWQRSNQLLNLSSVLLHHQELSVFISLRNSSGILQMIPRLVEGRAAE